MEPPQNKLIQLLKKKGTGATMGKSLSAYELNEFEQLLMSDEGNLTTKATLLTALLTLKPTPDESEWLQKVKQSPANYVPEELMPLLPYITPTDSFLKLIHQVISHQHLTEPEFLKAMDALFNPALPEHYKAAFLEAERLKRETEVENTTCLLDFINRSQHHVVNLPILIDIANPYDGFTRMPNLSPFLAALLGSIGIPTLLHGLYDIGPKYGITVRKLLKASGQAQALPIRETLTRLSNNYCAWGYIDQHQSFPELYDLANLRKNMVKRPMISTIEKLLCPIYSKYRHLVVTGYTHPPYRQKSITLYKHHPLFKEGIIFRGVEGSSQLPLDRRAPLIRVSEQHVHETFVSPEQYGISKKKYTETDVITIENNLKLGLAALKGNANWAKDQLLYQALTIIDGFDIKPVEEAMSALCLSLETGMAYQHWKAGIQ